MKRIFPAVRKSGLLLFVAFAPHHFSHQALADSAQVPSGQGTVAETSAPDSSTPVSPKFEMEQGRFRAPDSRYVPNSEGWIGQGTTQMKLGELAARGSADGSYTQLQTASVTDLTTLSRDLDVSDYVPPGAGCYTAFVHDVGYDELSLLETQLPAEHFGIALDVTVQGNNCPVAVGYSGFGLAGGAPITRALRWKWSPGTPTNNPAINRISPSRLDELGPDISNYFPNLNPPAPGSLEEYYSSITLPLHISADGRSVYGSEQFYHGAYVYAHQKQGFSWDEVSATEQHFTLFPDLDTQAPDNTECKMSSVVYDASEIAPNRRMVGQGTSAVGYYGGGVCTGTYGRASSFSAVGGLSITPFNSGTVPGYAKATSTDGAYNILNELSGGRSKRSYFRSSNLAIAPVQLKYLPNQLPVPEQAGRYSQAEAIYMTPGNLSSVLIFGHSTVGNSDSARNRASAAVIWNANGDIIRNAGSALPGLGACSCPLDPEDCPDGRCPFAEARDGTAYQTMVGAAYLPRDMPIYDTHPCKNLPLHPATTAREAFIYTPSTGMQKLKDFALARLPQGSAARNNLLGWQALCEATSVYESSATLTIAGVGAQPDPENPGSTIYKGFVIHMPKTTGPTSVKINYLKGVDRAIPFTSIYQLSPFPN